MNSILQEVTQLVEARQKGVTYTEKKVKNVVDKVTATLSGTQSASMTKVAKRYARLEASLKAMKEKHDELNARLKEDVQGLFDAEDVVLTRVVETAQFTLTMAKEIKKAEGTKVVDYEKIIAALSVLIPDELQSKIDTITEKYTTYLPPKDPIKRLSVSKEVGAPPIKEGLYDTIKNKAKSLLKTMTSWAARFDKKLDNLKKQAGMVKESLHEGIAPYDRELDDDAEPTVGYFVKHDNGRFAGPYETPPKKIPDTSTIIFGKGVWDYDDRENYVVQSVEKRKEPAQKDVKEGEVDVTPSIMRRLDEAAQDGDRIVADGKTIYPGFGNRSGLHSYLATALREVHDKKWPNCKKKLETQSYKMIQIHEFRNIDRDRGRWIVTKTWGG